MVEKFEQIILKHIHYEQVLMKLSMNANIIKLENFHKRKYNMI